MEVPKSCIIVNPAAGAPRQRDRLKELLGQQNGHDWWPTKDGDHVHVLTRRAVEENYDQIIVAGGDGTVNAVVDTLMDVGGDVRVGVLPVGTGNDLVRTLGIPQDDLRDASSVLAMEREVRLDVLHLACETHERYGINVAVGGFGGQVDEKMTTKMKEKWGPLAYIFGAASALPDLHEYETYLSVDDGPSERINAFNIIVANGRTVAGGKRVAPQADPCDGLLDLVIVEQGSLLAMAGVGTLLMTGDYTESEFVRHRRVERVHVASTPGMWFNIDGELYTQEPITISVVPRALRFLVGPDFTRRPRARE